MTAPDLLTTREVAEMAGVSDRTVETWRARGTGPRFHTLSNRAVVYARADVEQWLKGFRPNGNVGKRHARRETAQ